MGNAESSPSSGDDDDVSQSSRNYWHGLSDPSVEPSLRRPPLATKNADGSARGMQRAKSSFLEEPVISKATERGEAAVSVGASGSGEGPKEEEEGGGADASVTSSKLLRYAVSEMQGWRSHMEDMHVLNPKLHTNRQQKQLLSDHHLFAVFDGHGGDYASHFCGENLVSTLTTQKDWKKYLKLSARGHSSSSSADKRGSKRNESVLGLSLLKGALTSAFLELDAKLKEAQRARRLDQLSQLESLVYMLGGNGGADVFREGTDDHASVVNFAKQSPPSMPNFVPLERSGSTGVVVLITPSHIICANAGDSRAVLSRKRSSAAGGCECLPLSFDHKPANDVEVTRVERDGGFVRSGRVDGDLAVSRGFGDFGYKNANDLDLSSNSIKSEGKGSNKGQQKHHGRANSVPKDDKVTVHPDILVHAREPDRDEFVVLACDGIWDRLTNRECGDLVRSLARDEGETDVGLICEEVIDTALELDSRDNMTVCTVFFPAAEIDPPGDANNNDRGVRKRRTDREERWGAGSTPAKRAEDRMGERRKKLEVAGLIKPLSKENASRALSRDKARAQSREKTRLQQGQPLNSSSRSKSGSSTAASSRASSRGKTRAHSGGSSSSDWGNRKHKAPNSPGSSSVPRNNSGASSSRVRLQVATGKKRSKQ